MKEKVSIIIPLYNGARFIERCVRSLIGQTYQNIEIIIINDGSTDDSGKISDMLSQKDGRIRVLHQENRGVSSARNKGLKTASGDLIAFCDADDFVQECYIERMVRAVQDTDFVACGYLREKANQTSEKYLLDKQEISVNDFCYHTFCTPYITGACWNKLFKRHLIEDECFDETLAIGEDMLFVAKYLKKCQSVKYVAEPLYIYCLNKNSALQNNYTKKKLNKNVVSNIEAALKIDATLRGVNEEINAYLSYRIVRSNLWVLFQMIICNEYDRCLGIKIRKNIRRYFKEYSGINYGGTIQRLAVIGTAISPSIVFFFGKIINTINPRIFSRQLV